MDQFVKYKLDAWYDKSPLPEVGSIDGSPASKERFLSSLEKELQPGVFRRVRDVELPHRSSSLPSLQQNKVSFIS